jgi:hypothetical protein
LVLLLEVFVTLGHDAWVFHLLFVLRDSLLDELFDYSAALLLVLDVLVLSCNVDFSSLDPVVEVGVVVVQKERWINILKLFNLFLVHNHQQSSQDFRPVSVHEELA